MRCFNCNKFGHMSQCCKVAAKCTTGCGKDKHEGQCEGPKLCSNCNGPHASSAKDCPVWQKEKEIQHARAEKRISFLEARELVEAKMLTTLLPLLGDFSSHSLVWGHESYNSRGQMLEDLFSEMDLCILNDGLSTYIHPANGSTSALDLSICGPSLVLDYEWNIHEDLCGSDHFPVILTSNAVEEEAAPDRWNFKKADWLSFQAQSSSELTEEAVMSAEDPASQFTDLLIQAADKAIPKTRFSKKLPKVPWFNDSCKKAIKERKKAQRQFNIYS